MNIREVDRLKYFESVFQRNGAFQKDVRHRVNKMEKNQCIFMLQENLNRFI